MNPNPIPRFSEGSNELSNEPSDAVTPAQPRPGTFSRFVELLTAPSQELVEAEDRRRAQLLAALLLCLIPLGSLAIVAVATTTGKTMSLIEGVQQFGSLSLLVGAYFLSRTTQFRPAALLAATVVIAGNWLAISHEQEIARVTGMMGMSLSGVLVAAAILSVRTTIIISIANLIASAAIPALHPDIALESMVPALWALGFLTALIVLVGTLMNQDVEDLQERQTRLRTSDERYTLAARAANDSLWDWDHASGAVYYSPRWYEMVGVPSEDSPGDIATWFERVHTDDLEEVQNALHAHLEGRTDCFESAHRILHSDGTWRWIQARGLAVRDADGIVTRMAGSLADITAQKRYEERLVYDAFHDGLTGLPNRALLLDRLRQCIGRASRRKDYLYAVLFMDLDGFKLVNDSLGHATGDQLLVHVADRLAECLRPGDTVARLGGDEFIVLLDDVTDLDDVLKVAARIQEVVAQPVELRGDQIRSGASIGIAMGDAGYSRAEDPIRDADTAMYQAKANGRGQSQVFEEGMHLSAVTRLHVQNDLNLAISRDELRLVYQPIVNLETLRVVGFEALVRWFHSEHGLIGPAEFIPIAEETGLITDIDRWVIKHACEQQAEWRTRFARDQPLTINVNCSGVQFRNEQLPMGVGDILKQTGLDPHDLQIELTETVVMERAERSRRALAGLRQRGIRICVDDFGTGYSSLSYLDAFDIDGLKIDRSFVSAIRDDPYPPKVVQAIIDLGHNLGLKVTAEGVETKLQLRKLRELGCDLAQGFLLGRPMSADQAEALLNQGKIEV